MRCVSAAVFAGALACAVVCDLPTARASILDFSVSGGVSRRSLSTTDYSPSPVVQASMEVGIVPSIFYLGPYFNFTQATPKLLLASDSASPSGSKFYGVGLRARIVIPLPDPVAPYFLAGAGLVHANFPNQILSLCTPDVGTVAARCAAVELPNASANFVELTLGGGLRFDLTAHLRLFLEVAWQPTFGYQNDTWESAAHQIASSGSFGALSPSRNGYAFVANGGLMISL
jgi:opacity protein-like surface antigen